jgi:hypothetical protein
MNEYDLFIPLCHNDGRPIEAEKLEQLRDTLLDHFGGLTAFPQPNKGFWRIGSTTYRDEIIIYRALASDGEGSRRFLRQLKQRLEKELEQDEILILQRDVETL